MSEYVKIQVEQTDDPDVVAVVTNQALTDDVEEVYNDPDAGEEGSPIAQMLFNGVEGIAALTITEDTLMITREPDTPWEDILDEVRDALRDFFL